MPPTPTAPAPQQTPPPAAVDLVGQALERNSDGPGFDDWLRHDMTEAAVQLRYEFDEFECFNMILAVFIYGSPITQAYLERRMTPRLNAAVARRDAWAKAWAAKWLETHTEE